ncbi:flavin reductase family protein [Streptomyces sp. NPDC048417]|uniref:flavin reductase family protein n=1 Tax=Streptomyces sp. NPDC048417 TaxID=3155387 RepID=UPI0034344CE4
MSAPLHRSPSPTATASDGADILRDTLRRHAAGVTVITFPGPVGFTATSFTSVSLRPALVSFCIGLEASSTPAARLADRFAVHVLGTANAGLAGQFARSGVDRFAGVRWRAEQDGLPILDDVTGWLSARVTLRQTIGDHLLVVGEIDSGAVVEEAPALVHHNGSFAAAHPLG